MGLTKLRTWVLGTVLLALVLVAGLWFLLLSPALDASANVRAEAEATSSANDVRSVGLAALKTQSEQLPQMRADLQALQAAVPSSAQIPELLRQLQDTAAAHQVTLQSVQVQTPTAATTAPSPAATPSPSASPTTATAAASGLVLIPVVIQTSGDRANLDAFLSDLQTVMARLVVVTGVTETRSDASGGPPFTDQISGTLLVLPDPNTPATAQPTATATPSPTATAVG